MEQDSAHMTATSTPSNGMALMALDLDNFLPIDMSLSHHLDAFTTGIHDDTCLDQKGFSHCTITSKNHALSPSRLFPMGQRSLSQTHARQRHSISNLPPPAPPFPDRQSNHHYPSPWDAISSSVFHSNISCSDFDNCQDNDCGASASCNSDCQGSCPSQCGDDAHSVCCEDDACIEKDCTEPSVPCPQTSCPITDNEAAAAVALTSFGHKTFADPTTTAAQQVLPPTPDIVDNCFLDLPAVPCASLSLENSFGNAPVFSGQMWDIAPEFILANHIMQYHDPAQHDGQIHAHDCIADKPSSLMPMCSLPKTTPEGINPHGVDAICGFQVQDPFDFAQHIFHQHRPAPLPHENNLDKAIQNNSSTHHVLENQHHHSHFLPTASPSTNLSLTTSLSPATASLPTPSTLEGTNYFADVSSSVADSSPETCSESQSTCRWLVKNSTGGHEICGFKCSDHKTLQDHCKADHLKKIKKDHAGFYCQWQGCTRHATFSQRSKLERHMQVHTGYKPVQCHICGASLSAKQSLEQHMRTHTGEKPWVCSFDGCNQSFKQQSALTMHERTHTGVKPLQCDICGKKFGESSNLSKHRRIHNIRGSHVCEICGKDFHRLDQLRRHMGTNHKDRPEELRRILSRVKSGRVSKTILSMSPVDDVVHFC